MDLQDVFQIMSLENNADKETLLARYHSLKKEYSVIKEDTNDLKTRFLYQMKLIELDDAYLYYIKYHM